MTIQEMIANSKQVRYRDIPESVTVYDIMCTGNSGRSPLAEAIARDKLSDLGLDKILVISSGTERDAIESGSISDELQRMVVKRALDRNDELGFYDPNELQYIRDLLFRGDRDVCETLGEYDSRARSVFTDQEETFRKRIASKMRLKTPIKNGGQQTEVHLQIRWCRALANSNEEKAREIYSESGYHPDFINFGIENTFGLPFNQYELTAYNLKEKIEADIENIAAEAIE